MVALLAYHFGWSLQDILNLAPSQIHILQHGLSDLLYDINGGSEKDKETKLKDYAAKETEKMQKTANLPKGKIKLGEMLKALDVGEIKVR